MVDRKKKLFPVHVPEEHAFILLQVSQWLSFSFSDPAMQQSMDFLRALDAELLNNSYLAGPCLTISDIVAYWMVHPVVVSVYRTRTLDRFSDSFTCLIIAG